MTIEEFGKTIKEKYPQYEDVSDRELGERMLVKYPAYQDMIQRDPAPQKFEPLLSGHGVLKGISELTGIAGIARGIAEGIFL